jgi:hypothetical protein
MVSSRIRATVRSTVLAVLSPAIAALLTLEKSRRRFVGKRFDWSKSRGCWPPRRNVSSKAKNHGEWCADGDAPRITVVSRGGDVKTGPAVVVGRNQRDYPLSSR